MAKNKIKVVIASVLKPVDDVRAYYKLGLSLAETNKYLVNIIGYPSKNPPSHPNIKLYALKEFNRTSLKRLTVPFRVAQMILKVRPSVVIVTTAELLLVMMPIKILFGIKLIYDVQENTKRNIIWSHQFSLFGRLYGWLQIVAERISKSIIDYYILAEKCYQNELHFLDRAKFTIIENKALSVFNPDRNVTLSETPLKLLYIGTISLSYGINDAISLTKKLNALHVPTTLTVAGHCPDKNLYKSFIDKNYEWLIKKISTSPIPYPELVKEYKTCHAALVSYKPNPANRDCFPTKIYECLLYRVPMIMKQDSPWLKVLNNYNAGISINFMSPDPSMLKKLHNNQFYDGINTQQWSWEANEHRIVAEAINLVLSK